MVAPVAHRIRPSGWWYALAPLALVAALAVGGVMVRDGWQEAQRVALDANIAAPGLDQTISIDEPGGYTVAYLGEAHLESDLDKEQFAEELQVQILPSGGGDALPLAVYDGFQEIPDADGTQYVPLRTVHFEEGGEYVLRTRPQPGLDPEKALVVVTRSPWRELGDAVRAAGVLLLVATFASIVGSMILARVRGRAKNAARAAAFGPWGGGWPGGPAPGPYGPPTGGWAPPGPPGWGR